MALTTTNATGAQTTTQNPQSAGSASTGTQSSSVQPGTKASALTSNEGVQLQPKQLSTVPIATTTSTGTTQVPVQAKSTSPVLTAASIGLFVIAIILFALMARDDKTTTES